MLMLVLCTLFSKAARARLQIFFIIFITSDSDLPVFSLISSNVILSAQAAHIIQFSSFFFGSGFLTLVCGKELFSSYPYMCLNNMFPSDYLIFLQIILFLFITGLPRVVIVSHTLELWFKKICLTAVGDVTANTIQGI